MIDWQLAEKAAHMVGGTAPPPLLPTQQQLEEMAVACEKLVCKYTKLKPKSELPAAELVSRSEWSEANLANLQPLIDPITVRFAEKAGPLQGPLKAIGGTLIAAQVGLLVGYLSHRVLGQYDIVILSPEIPGRLLFVGQNIESATEKLAVEPAQFWQWIALHEVTHAVQFTGVPWLRMHLAEQVRELFAAMEMAVDRRALTQLTSGEGLRGLIDAVRDGELVQFFSTPEQRVILDRLQATMAVIEGHAEHVMDAAGRDLLPALPQLRVAMTQRRHSQAAIHKLLNRLLGMDLKMRQYEHGKWFCDTVIEEYGIKTFNRVWRSPDALPTLSELYEPHEWVARTSNR